jgi:hypothetical protein
VSDSVWPEGDHRAMLGWWVGAALIAAILLIGAALWFMYHP